MMKRIFIVICISVLCATAYGQEELSLSRCREIALGNNHEIKAAGYQTGAAKHTSLSVRGNFFPAVKGSAAGVYSSVSESLKIKGGNLPVLTPSDASPSGYVPTGEFAYFPGLSIDFKVRQLFNTGITLEQPIYAGGKIRAAYRLSKLGVEIAEQKERLTRSEVILATDRAYAAAVKARELEKVAEKYNEALAELYRNIDAALRQGMATRNDLLKVQVKLNESELQLMKARNAIRISRINLCHTVGLPLDSDITVSSTVPEFEIPSDLDADITRRPEFDMLGSQVLAAGEELRLKRADKLPQLGLVANYGYTYGAKVNDEVLFNGMGANVMISLSIPIFHFGEKSNTLKSAECREKQLREEQMQRNEMMFLEATQSVNTLIEAGLECEVAEKSLSQAAENMRVSALSYEYGEETLSGYLEAQALWQQAWQAKVEASYKLFIAYAEYCRTTGMSTTGTSTTGTGANE